MRTARWIPGITLVLLVPAYLYLLTTVAQLHKQLPKSDDVSILLPAPLLKISSLDYDGLAADALFFKALVFYGSSFDGNKRRELKEWEYDWLHKALSISTDLDPYFLDPYFLANATLAWEANRVQDANALLTKGSQFRTWDYWLPYLIGFNHYYFLDDNIKGAEFLMEASKKPGADPFFGFLATRFSYNSNRTENAITFIEGVLNTTKDETMRRDYKLRLEALKNIKYLEQGVSKYKAKLGKLPSNISQLFNEKIIDSIPTDPYGGSFYLRADGSVKTSSDLREKPTATKLP